MIISKEVSLTVNNRYVKYYKEKGFNIKGGDVIIVKIKDLPLHSNVRVDIKCDKCNDDKNIKYTAYIEATKNQTEPYYCKKCNNIKRKITVNEKYGCDNVFQNEKVKEKSKNTLVERYGEDHPSKIEEFRDKMKLTNMERYGVEYPLQNEEIKKKMENYNIEKYGVKNPMCNITVANKSKKTNLERYCVENVFELDLYRLDSMMNKYGVEHALQLDIFKEKVKDTVNINYGCDNPMQNDDVKQRMIQTKKDRGFYNSRSRTEFETYRQEVKRITNSNKNELYENWDGYDFYDKEYIKENLKLDSNDVNFPTIDHKISIFYGFNNNISVEVVGNIDNLCYTKRCINSSKNTKNSDDYV